MNIIFNEISFLPQINDEYVLKDYFMSLVKLFEKAKNEYGFSHLLFPINLMSINVLKQKTFSEWVCCISHQGEKNKILSVIKRPYSEDVLSEEINSLNKYYFKNEDAGISETYCNGLATAYLTDSLCISLHNQALWDITQIDFCKIINDEFETEPVSVKNISKEEHFKSQDMSSFVDNIGNITPDETLIEPENKPISLKHDHGYDKLMAFSKRLRQSKYILAIINSLPFNPKAVNLIKEVYPDGKIELVLYWEDKGIGVIVQTTGKNYRETKAIAEFLKEKFDK